MSRSSAQGCALRIIPLHPNLDQGYDRGMGKVTGAKVTIHSTITGNVADRPGYLEEFIRFWSEQPQVKRIWISLFTPRRGASDPEILTLHGASALSSWSTCVRLGPLYPKLEMPPGLVREILSPPKSPEECIFARTTHTLSADLKTKITPCQFGGDPDCSQCGCIASMALAAVGNHRVIGGLTAGQIFRVSNGVGAAVAKAKNLFDRPAPEPEPAQFNIL